MKLGKERRTYGQDCLLAKALDLIGGRWTLLVVRELLSGPKRFTDLLEALQGIGTNLLVERLRHLEREEIVERSAGRRPLYRLTRRGLDLRPALREFFAWSASGRSSRSSRAELPVSASRAFALFFDENARPRWQAVVELRIPRDSFAFRFDCGSLETLDVGEVPPDLIVATRGKSWSRIVSGETTLREERKAGRIRVEGSKNDFESFCAVFGLLAR